MDRRTASTLKIISIKADELARQYNRTKDPGIRDQWYKKLKQVPPESALSHKKT